MAAAYHWEARRRQMRLERRLRLLQEKEASGEKDCHQILREVKEKPPSQLPPSKMAQNSAPHEVRQDLCPCKTDHVQNHSGKLLKRYSSTEYVQQW